MATETDRTYGANTNVRKASPEFVNLRSKFNYAEGRKDVLEQGYAYFPGGNRDAKNACTFTNEYEVYAAKAGVIGTGLTTGRNPTITLYLSPSNVTWDYTLRTNIVDTYGGQVVQILGVSIENLTIEGFFGLEGMWGLNTKIKNEDPNSFNFGRYQSRFVRGDRRVWDEDYGQYGNGLVQFSEWFKRYFYQTTQAGGFAKQNITFKYPHMGWEWSIRPLTFPQVRFANNELLPQWRIECDFIEDVQGTFTQTVTANAKAALGRYKNGVGFKEFIEWSQPVYKTTKDRAEIAGEIAASYSDIVGGEYSEKDIETLIARGFSHPVVDNTPYLKNPKAYKTSQNPNRLESNPSRVEDIPDDSPLRGVL